MGAWGVSHSLWDREGSSQDRMSNLRAEAGVSQRKGREGANSLMTQSLELVGVGLELQSQGHCHCHHISKETPGFGESPMEEHY